MKLLDSILASILVALATWLCLPCRGSDLPKNKDPDYYRIAKKQYETGQFSKSLDAAEHGLIIAPGLLSLQIIKGQSLDALGRYSEAISVWEQLSDLSEPYFLMSLARDLRLNNDSKRALLYANNAVKLAEEGAHLDGSIGLSLFSKLGTNDAYYVNVPMWYYIEKALILLSLQDSKAAAADLEYVESECLRTQAAIRRRSGVSK